MKEELIHFETAKLAQEKGFNTIKIISRKKTEAAYYAPTQSLLQRWLREVHNIHIWITRFLISEQEFCYNIENYEGLRQNRGEFETYEEALEIGLQEALKLIK